MNGFKKYLSKEIGIEFKACLYFWGILFFYGVYRVMGGNRDADIVVIAEMIFTAYVMGYIQVYLLREFDEAEHFGVWQVVSSIICTVLYTLVSYLGGWYDKNITATVCFGAYMLFMFLCVFWVYKVKRDIDTKLLNEQLNNFKKTKTKEECVRETAQK